jgi:hypothetical protein
VAQRCETRLEALDRDADAVVATVGEAERTVSRDVAENPSVGHALGPLRVQGCAQIRARTQGQVRERTAAQVTYD